MKMGVAGRWTGQYSESKDHASPSKSRIFQISHQTITKWTAGYYWTFSLHGNCVPSTVEALGVALFLLPRVKTTEVSRNAVVFNFSQLLWLSARPPACPHLLPISPWRSPHKHSHCFKTQGLVLSASALGSANPPTQIPPSTYTALHTTPARVRRRPHQRDWKVVQYDMAASWSRRRRSARPEVSRQTGGRAYPRATRTDSEFLFEQQKKRLLGHGGCR
ncbi:hypothetical protein SKAU_G00310460 [Synaphobranchus kaupii]|uniref:Uncharacterized protein n=1 Tax=Synaphobranchus kaupii TaxID=118154 RepID=A0A9Q1ERP3_SYNKA|nr:hypothetical protein SKAU_G00310460 [Synaphobranchus kaupii]